MLAADAPRRPWQVHLLKRSGKGLNPVLAPGGAGAGPSTGDWRDSWCAARRTAQAARTGIGRLACLLGGGAADLPRLRWQRRCPPLAHRMRCGPCPAAALRAGSPRPPASHTDTPCASRS